MKAKLTPSQITAWATAEAIHRPVTAETIRALLVETNCNASYTKHLLTAAEALKRDPLELWEAMKPFRNNPLPQ